ncbi:MAG: DUF4012 domain-containing protein [Candidatus Daviesbacteria bacterium]|nr:DUF4012 domain-containing protein [Candidatus Daviesbacteria bacterium]
MPRTGSKRKIWKKVIIVILVLLIFFYIPGYITYNSVKKVIAGGKTVNAGLKQENLDVALVGLDETKIGIDRLQFAMKLFIWMRIIPFVGGYYADAASFVSAASYETTVAKKVIGAVLPYKNELGFTGTPVPGQDRVAQALKILTKIIPDIDKLEPDLKKARLEVESVNTGKYPEYFGSRKLRVNLEAAKNFIVGSHIVVSENRELLGLLPQALGQNGARSYLMLFQNDKEIRATGGFLTAYAFMSIENGHISTSDSNDIYQLDQNLLKTCLNVICPLKPPAPIVKYLPEFDGKPRTAWSLRDSNLSPDLAVSMADFEKLYKFIGGGLPFDGIITIDTQVVEELIKVTGPVEIFGTTYSAETDKRCNCPNVIYELEHYAEVAAKGEADRKAVLGTLMQQILIKVLGSGPDKLPELVNVGSKLAHDKHIMFYMHDPKFQSELAKLNWTGEIKRVKGDYLHINDSNFAGGKSNLYVEEKVLQEINIDEGVVSNKLTIEYKNPQPFSTWLNGILRDYVRIYVPKGSTLTKSQGSDDPVQTLEDEVLDKTYFEAFITVRPQNSRVLTFEYVLPEKFNGKSYPLLIQKQPGAKDHKYTLKINGKKKDEFELTSDKQLNLSI